MSPHDPHNPHSPDPAGAADRGPARKPGLLRSLGQFTGHLVSGLKTPATPPATQTHKSVEEETATDEQGRTVILRRTTIEEVEMKDR